MGRLIAVVGTTGVGKTTFVRALCQAGDFACGLEEHEARPFQALFKSDPRHALANQMDYFLLRARQEKGLRHGIRPGLLDGGLEVDFHGFTRLFHTRGWLSDTEYHLCKDFYDFIRSFLPPPDLVISLKAGHEIIFERLSGRNRINIATAQDINLLDSFLDEWLATVSPGRVLRLDTNRDDLEYRQEIQQLLVQIEEFFGKI